MTGVDIRGPGKGNPSHPSEAKADIEPQKQGQLDNGNDKSVVKQVPPNQAFWPALRPVNERTATLRPQAKRQKWYVDGDNRNILPTNVKFKKPPKPFVERHRHKLGMAAATLSTFGGGIAGVATGNTVAAIVAASSSTVATSISTALGGAAGSVIPIVGTAIGAVIGFAVGALVGHLITKYGRSHSRRRYLDNAKKSLEQQDIKFTPEEEKRLKDIRPDQWKYLAKLGAPIIKELRGYAMLVSGSQRWAKQFFYQYAIMNIAKVGYPKALIQVKGVLKVVKAANNKVAAVKREWELKKMKARGKAERLIADAGERIALAKLPFLPKVVTVKMLTELEDFGVDAFRNAKAARTTMQGRILDEERSRVKQRWDTVATGVKQAFGDDALDLFNKRFERYADAAVDPKYAEANLANAKLLQGDLRDFLKPFIAQYDEAIRTRVLKLVDKYAVEVAVGNVSGHSLLEPFHNFDRRLVEELIDTAVRLQAIKDGSEPPANNRVPRDIVVRRATLPHRISGYAGACERESIEVYGRFVGGADDIYDECEQLLEISETQLARFLGGTGKKSSKPGDIRANRQAENLRHIARLAGRLKNARVSPDKARMILRIEAHERCKLESVAGGIDKVTVQPGWSPALNANPDADMPRKQLVTRAHYAVVQARALYSTLTKDPDFEHLTPRDAQDIYFRLTSAHWDVGYADNKYLQELRKNNFAGVKKILSSGVDPGTAAAEWARGARSIKEAIDCARLGIDIRDVLKVKSEVPPAELTKWQDKGFSDAEIAAYRNKLADWQPDASKKPGHLVKVGYLGIDDERIAYLPKSNLAATEALSMLALGLVPNAPDLPEIKLRHPIHTTHVLADKPEGKGGQNEVIRQTVRTKNGAVEQRVFKQIPFTSSARQNAAVRQRVGANLAASMVNEELGFNAIVHTQLSTRRGNVGISMELAKGYTAVQLRDGEAFVAVPENEPRYAKLQKAVKEDMAVHGAISDDTLSYAKTLGFTRLRMVNGQLQAAGDFMAKLINDPKFQELMVDLQIIDFLTDELDRHSCNYMIEVKLGPNGIEAVAIKGIDNDGGFAAENYYPQSVRTLPRVISRRQANAIRKAYVRWQNNRGVKKKLKQVVVPSKMVEPVKPDVAFPFEHSRAATAADLPPPEDGDQVSQFGERLELLYKTVIAAEDGKSPVRPDKAPALTIISDPAPQEDLKDDIKIEIENDNIQLESENKADKEISDNADENNKYDIKEDTKDNTISDNKDDIIENGARSKNDKKETWGSGLATGILTNTSSIVARQNMLLN